MQYRIHTRHDRLVPPSAGIVFVDESSLEAMKARLRGEGYQIVAVTVEHYQDSRHSAMDAISTA